MKIPKARKLPSGNWFIQMRLNGKSVPGTFPTEEAAYAWARSYKEAHHVGRNNVHHERLLRGVIDDIETVQNDKGQMICVATELEHINNMDGNSFEEYCASLLLLTNYFNAASIRITKKAVDYGADIIIRCFDGFGISIQCKRQKAGVNIAAIQEVTASKKHYNTDAAAVITNSYFTRSAKELAKDNGVALFDRKMLIKLIEKKIRILYAERGSQWTDLLKELKMIDNV